MASVKRTAGHRARTRRHPGWAGSSNPRAVSARKPSGRDRRIASALLAWFAEAKRPLPWRANYDPYAVWISEVMLQQTQVDTVLPYYRRWMERFPTLADVARAPLEAVLKAWEGLGYYSRARNLHGAAQALVGRHGGRIPDSLAALRALPGIGPYSAGAIASIAFNRATPLVDGNVSRVLVRLLGLDGDVRRPDGRAAVWSSAERFLNAAIAQGGQPRDFNEGLMELGALICRPRAPQCLLCPWRTACRARKLGVPEAFPRRPVRKARPVRHGVMLLAQRTGHPAGPAWLVRRRPPRGIWGGLWEFPWAENPPNAGCATALCAALLTQAGESAGAASPTPLGHISHGLTHLQLELDCLFMTLAEEPGFQEGPHRPVRWVTSTELAQLPMARISHKALALLSHQRRQDPERTSLQG